MNLSIPPLAPLYIISASIVCMTSSSSPTPSAGAAFTKRAPAPRPTPIVNVVVTMPLALFESEAVVLNPPLHGSVLVGKFHDEEDALRSGLVTDIAELIYVWVVGEDVNGAPVSAQLFVFRQESAPATT